MKIAWIGTGVMGESMAGHLLDAGHELYVYNRTVSKTENLVKRGAKLLTEIKDAPLNADVVFTMVGYPKDVEGVSSLSTKPLDVVETIKKGSLKLTSPVRIKDNGEDIEVSIYVNMKPGYKIVSVASDIQTNVKDAVTTMTGKKVSKVNVIIAGIDFDT